VIWLEGEKKGRGKSSKKWGEKKRGGPRPRKTLALERNRKFEEEKWGEGGARHAKKSEREPALGKYQYREKKAVKGSNIAIGKEGGKKGWGRTKKQPHLRSKN